MRDALQKEERGEIIDNIGIDKSKSWQIFDSIFKTYDFTNHLLSFGMDILWRKKLKKLILERDNQNILDLATGTADVLLAILSNNKKISKAYGVDLSKNMLELGRKKIKKKGLFSKVDLKEGDITSLEFNDNTFDLVTIAFGIRNATEPVKVLDEMYRVLKSGGRSLILEFSLPENEIIKFIDVLYLRSIVPILGGIISGNFSAYKYLNSTIENFPYGEKFCSLMTSVGFKNIKRIPLMYGVASIYYGDK